MEELKKKIKTIVSNSRFCGLCLNSYVNVEHFDTYILIGVSEGYNMISIRSILCEAFENKSVDEFFFSDHICNSCRDMTVNFYIFKYNVISNAEKLKCYINMLDLNTSLALNQSDDHYLEAKHLHMYLCDDKGKNNIIKKVPDNEEDCIDDRVSVKFDDNAKGKRGAKSDRNKKGSRIKNIRKFKPCSFCSKDICEHWKYILYFYSRKTKKLVTKVKCKLCSYSCKTLNTYLYHMNRAHLGIYFECDNCSKLFYSKSKLINHFSECTESNCTHCGTKFTNIYHLETHELICDKNENAIKFEGLNENQRDGIVVFEARKFECEICKKEFKQKHNLHIHFKQNHDQNNDYSVTCSVCQEVLSDKKELSEHLAGHSKFEKHKCVPCNLEFRNKMLYTKHTRGMKHILKVNPNATNKFKIRYMDLTCSVCQKRFGSTRELNAHLDKYPSGVKHRCTLCDVVFETRREYTEHTKKIVHKRKIDPIGRYLCPYCDYASHHHLSRDIHVQKIHLVTSPHECHLCHKKFPDEITLQKHVLDHEVRSVKPEKNKVWICHTCGKKLVNSTALKKHMRLHTGERPYDCDFCNEKFISASQRKAHFMTKHCQRSICCPLCRRAFHTVGNMRNHVRKVHWKRNEKFDYTKLEGLAEEDYELFKDHRGVNAATANKKY